mgnify:CR=1 FL=1
MACGEPDGPACPNWTKVAALPAGIVLTGGLCGKTYVTGYYDNGGPACILKYSGGTWAEVYRADDPSYYLCDVQRDHAWKSLWACGYYSGNIEYEPYLIKEDPKGGTWVSAPLPGFAGFAVSTVVPIDEGACWLTLDDYYLPGDRDGLLGLYRNGQLALFPELGKVTIAYSNEGLLFAIPYPEFSTCVRSGKADIFITSDFGKTWVKEIIPEEVLGGREIKQARALTTNGPDLFFAVNADGPGALGIIERSGGPGSGKYQLKFFSYTGPYFLNICDFAIRPRRAEPYGISKDAVGVGDLTTVVFTADVPIVEILPYPVNFFRVISASSPGFFAIGYEYATKEYGLYYHP